ncbi:MAG: zinc ribbon domain-containing protein [Candidatus Omnitrophica bacterium]|nr:zinc ribbon domain-containing protein [Candidatus Omnitrophota bacterium]
MPTYEYRCDSCAYVFERFQSITDDALKKCPQCGSLLRRVIGAGAGIIFKGKGFYQTDYKNASAGKDKKKDQKKKTEACCGSDTCPSCD